MAIKSGGLANRGLMQEGGVLTNHQTSPGFYARGWSSNQSPNLTGSGNPSFESHVEVKSQQR